MTTTEYKSMYGATCRVSPYENRHTCIEAESFAFVGEERQYKVNWPSIGGVSVDEARQFSAAINAAYDWLEKKKEEALCKS